MPSSELTLVPSEISDGSMRDGPDRAERNGVSAQFCLCKQLMTYETYISMDLGHNFLTMYSTLILVKLFFGFVLHLFVYFPQ